MLRVLRLVPAILTQDLQPLFVIPEVAAFPLKINLRVSFDCCLLNQIPLAPHISPGLFSCQGPEQQHAEQEEREQPQNESYRASRSGGRRRHNG